MPQFGIWRFSGPIYDVADTSGVAPTADPVETDGEGSLSDHEASYGARAERAAEPSDPAEAEPAAETRERDETGKFKPRHRAKSQQATAEDVPRINELTRKLREAEARAEAAERRTAQPAAATETPKPATSQEKPQVFPEFDVWLTRDGNADKGFNDWLTAYHRFNYEAFRAEERQQEARTAAERDYQTKVKAFADKLPDALKRYPDYDDVVKAAPEISMALEDAYIAIGPDAAYYLATHPEECAELTRATWVPPNNPAFAQTVALATRHLKALVAAEQRPSPSSRAAAGSTGAALALVATTTPKPPTPVRTGALRDADAPPSEDSSLAEHERAYGPKKRRA